MQQDTITNNKRIAKNTLFLYIRMLVTMIISLYTSRVVLQVLGVDDFGIYQAVGGIVGFLSFINGALSTGSSRFITFGLGEGKLEKQKKIFATTLTSHIILALVIIVVAETVGLWFLYHKMVIPPERMEAALWVFHLSILAAFVSLTQVPYNACIIAHEKMTVYAYVSIIDASCKLLIVYMLYIGQMDKLILYAILHMVLQVSILFFYRFYCIRHFSEARFELRIDKEMFKEIVGFSGWSLFSNTAIALNNQGILLLLNMFFAPAVVAARSISIQVDMTAYQFVTNFQTAAVPQIVKRYAVKDYQGSKVLLLDMTKYSFFLMLLMAMPIFFTADKLLHLWLGIVPPYTTIFLQLIVIQSLIQVFDTSFYKALYAKGQLRENALLSPTCLLINFPIVYCLFKLGFSPVALSVSTIVCYAIMAFVIKPILLVKLVGYKYKEILSVYFPCIKVLFASLLIPVVFYNYVESSDLSEFISFILVVLVCVISVIISTWYLGLNASMRERLICVVSNKLHGK